MRLEHFSKQICNLKLELILSFILHLFFLLHSFCLLLFFFLINIQNKVLSSLLRVLQLMLNLNYKGIYFLLGKYLSSIGQSLLHEEAVVLLGLWVALINKLLPKIHKYLLRQRLIVNLVILGNLDDFWQQGKGWDLKILILNLNINKSEYVVNILQVFSKIFAVLFHEQADHLQGNFHVLNIGCSLGTFILLHVP